MSHQTGIRANNDLLKYFGKLSDVSIRLVKIAIENDELKLAGSKTRASKNWETDWDKLILSTIDPIEPCYILYRFDVEISNEFEWLLISWVPEEASIRNKMLYASTKATLKSEFGSAKIKGEFHATSMDELSLKGYNRHKANDRAPAPLTMREEEIQEMRKSEFKNDYGVESRQQTLTGLECNVDDETLNAIQGLSKGRHNYVQFKIDLKKEQIILDHVANIDLLKLPSQIPTDQARYHLYLFKHTHEGDYIESYVFIYSMPGYACSVKERMLYSCCKALFVKTIEDFGLEISKKIEIDNGSELTEEFLYDQLHPKKILHKPLFAKPKGPPNRGVKRMTKGQQE